MIVIGVDGMDPVLVETHLASLPNLDRLRQQGAVPAANGMIGQSVF
jgi:predicted AlkP superfamily phosphohydrolase/phosphomutase